MWRFNFGNRTRIIILRYIMLVCCWDSWDYHWDISKGTATGFPLFLILAFFDELLIKWVKQKVATITNRDL